ncbi:hypothetical protein N6H14_13175 [Paenibacillus sp. CC-CFT747]|nr:hypothetical protein N6H14_13175 [Paenibacillus sp. CC-CFT747]
MVTLVVLAVLAFAVPLLGRRMLELVQGLAALVYLIGIVSSGGGVMANVWSPLWVFWVLGSLCALGLRSREAADESKRAHEYEFHRTRP